MKTKICKIVFLSFTGFIKILIINQPFNKLWKLQLLLYSFISNVSIHFYFKKIYYSFELNVLEYDVLL